MIKFNSYEFLINYNPNILLNINLDITQLILYFFIYVSNDSYIFL